MYYFLGAYYDQICIFLFKSIHFLTQFSTDHCNQRTEMTESKYTSCWFILNCLQILGNLFYKNPHYHNLIICSMVDFYYCCCFSFVCFVLFSLQSLGHLTHLQSTRFLCAIDHRCIDFLIIVCIHSSLASFFYQEENSHLVKALVNRHFMVFPVDFAHFQLKKFINIQAILFFEFSL